jgi:3-isopropylmalate/(R)-2-methylmalate dehydratase small subunit
MALYDSFSSHAVFMPIDNVDTDQIIPARFLKVTDKAGIGTHLFNDWRYNADGSEKPDFVLNEPRSKSAKILVAGNNFGCGSSREHAPWALVAFGFRAVVSTSFANIFSKNSLKNGLLPIVVDDTTHKRISALLAAHSTTENTTEQAFSIDLESQTLRLPDGSTTQFPIDAFSKHCLLHGVDELGYIMQHAAQIEAYEAAH